MAGFLSYEAGYSFEETLKTTYSHTATQTPLLWFGIYGEPETFDHSTNKTGNIASIDAFVPAITFDIDEKQYTERVQRIRSLIAAGDTYQANLTLSAQWKESRSAAEVFSNMMHTQPVEFGALIHTGEMHILSASPELFFQREDRTITTKPMKGTSRRGRWAEEDDSLAEWLQADEKNRSENLMIVDLLRNDLGRICEPGSISVPEIFQIERFPTVLQMTSTVKGILHKNCSYTEIFRALFPCGSIVGAPKIRTMQILREMEERPRGVYTGAIGYISPHKQATFSVAIRTVTLQNENAEMGVGSGIVYDSDPQSEYDECKAKTAFISQKSREFQLIETLLWSAGYQLLQEHMNRLEASSRYFRFSFDRQHIERALHETSRSFGCGSQHRVRLLLNQHGEANITSTPISIPVHDEISVLLAQGCTNSSDVMLFHKTTARETYEFLFSHAQQLHCQDAIFLNERKELTEGCIHNIFIVKDGQWLTPPLNSGLLPGIFRQHLLQTKANCRESLLTLNDLLHADEAYLCNSVRGLRKIKRLLQETATGVHLIWEQPDKHGSD